MPTGTLPKSNRPLSILSLAILSDSVFSIYSWFLSPSASTSVVINIPFSTTPLSPFSSASTRSVMSSPRLGAKVLSPRSSLNVTNRGDPFFCWRAQKTCRAIFSSAASLINGMSRVKKTLGIAVF